MPIVINNIIITVTIILALIWFCSPEYFEQETFSVASLEEKLLFNISIISIIIIIISIMMMI